MAFPSKKIITDSLNILIVAIVIGFIINMLHPRGFRLIKKNAIQDETIVYISPDKAKEIYDNKSALFIDTREYSQYIRGHIKGALHIPVHPEAASNKKIKDNFQIINSSKQLVLYCTGLSCGTSRVLAAKLKKLGYKRDILIIKTGFPEWEKSGYPVGK